jgi:hypothetical protein
MKDVLRRCVASRCLQQRMRRRGCHLRVQREKERPQHTGTVAGTIDEGRHGSGCEGPTRSMCGPCARAWTPGRAATSAWCAAQRASSSSATSRASKIRSPALTVSTVCRPAAPASSPSSPSCRTNIKRTTTRSIVDTHTCVTTKTQHTSVLYMHVCVCAVSACTSA